MGTRISKPKPRRGTGVQSNTGNLVPFLFPQLAANLGGGTMKFQVYDSKMNQLTFDKWVVTGDVFVWNNEHAAIELWECVVNEAEQSFELTAPTGIGEGESFIIQPWQLTFRGTNGEWLAPAIFGVPPE